MTLNQATGNYDQPVTIAFHADAPFTLPGSTFLVLDTLAGGTLANADGVTTDRVAGKAVPYVTLATGFFYPGNTLNITLSFHKKPTAVVTYVPRILADDDRDHYGGGGFE